MSLSNHEPQALRQAQGERLSRLKGVPFLLTEAQENELLVAMAEIERGEYVTLEELLPPLPVHN